MNSGDALVSKTNPYETRTRRGIHNVSRGNAQGHPLSSSPRASWSSSLRASVRCGRRYARHGEEHRLCVRGVLARAMTENRALGRLETTVEHAKELAWAYMSQHGELSYPAYGS
jgi:hypothetical protein